MLIVPLVSMPQTFEVSALSLMDQALVFGGGRIVESDVRAMLGTIERGHVVRLVEALAAGDAPALVETARALDEQAPDYDQALVEIAALLQRVALEQRVAGASAESGYEPAVLQRLDRKSTRLNSSHIPLSRMPSSA